MDYDNNNMKTEDLDYLADMISLNIIKYFETTPLFKPQESNTEEELLADLARLMTLLSAYETKQEYQKCDIIKNKIKLIQNKLNKL
jgi:hypothetical protein|tara:strand:+ start:64 stop:321 length:258 start_codon:yes stop_codon:yes gene_type:complete